MTAALTFGLSFVGAAAGAVVGQLVAAWLARRALGRVLKGGGQIRGGVLHPLDHPPP